MSGSALSTSLIAQNSAAVDQQTVYHDQAQFFPTEQSNLIDPSTQVNGSNPAVTSDDPDLIGSGKEGSALSLPDAPAQNVHTDSHYGYLEIPINAHEYGHHSGNELVFAGDCGSFSIGEYHFVHVHDYSFSFDYVHGYSFGTPYGHGFGPCDEFGSFFGCPGTFFGSDYGHISFGHHQSHYGFSGNGFGHGFDTPTGSGQEQGFETSPGNSDFKNPGGSGQEQGFETSPGNSDFKNPGGSGQEQGFGTSFGNGGSGNSIDNGLGQDSGNQPDNNGFGDTVGNGQEQDSSTSFGSGNSVGNDLGQDSGSLSGNNGFGDTAGNGQEQDSSFGASLGSNGPGATAGNAQEQSFGFETSLGNEGDGQGQESFGIGQEQGFDLIVGDFGQVPFSGCGRVFHSSVCGGSGNGFGPSFGPAYEEGSETVFDGFADYGYDAGTGISCGSVVEPATSFEYDLFGFGYVC